MNVNKEVNQPEVNQLFDTHSRIWPQIYGVDFWSQFLECVLRALQSYSNKFFYKTTL